MVLKSLFFCNSSLIISKIRVNIRNPSAIFSSSITRSNNRCSYYYFFSSSSSNDKNWSLTHQIAKAFHDHQSPKSLNPILLSKLQLHHVPDIILSLKSKPSSAIGFFEWAESFFISPLSAPSFCALLHVLLQNQLFSRAACVFDKFTMQFGNDYDTLDAFCDLDSTNPSVVYGFLIESYCRKGMFGKSFDIFMHVCAKGIFVSPNVVSLLLGSLVDSHCADVIVDKYGELCSAMREQSFSVYEFVMNRFMNRGEVEMGFGFHKALIEGGFGLDIITCNKILKAIWMQNDIGVADDYFNMVLRTGPKPNVVTFSTLIDAYCKERNLDKAFELFDVMAGNGVAPDLIVYSILIDGLFKAGRLEDGHRLLLVALDKGIKLDVIGFSSAMDAYVKIGDLGRVIQIYKRMLNEGISPNVVSCSILIKGFCQNGRILEACGLFVQILKLGFEPSILTYSALIAGFFKSGNVRDGLYLYEDMIKKRCEPDTIVYSVLINGLCKQGLVGDALRFFFQAMNRGLSPNVFTLNTLLDSFCRLKCIVGVMKVYNLMGMLNIKADTVTYTILIKGAAQLAYTILIRGYCKFGRLTEAMMLYDNMLLNRLTPDHFLERTLEEYQLQKAGAKHFCA
ncbi:hypothetical protein OIU77_008225 [Salix suchowensis]|uniref:Pentatricopeptide repeat-containing protein n=1 Tax=Salix suchowensis TaxID=1278906 RepID=A0ABQ9AIR6_9ROSI|nr:hypothetical protein OIU77_008225 [Salix suchowensis]